MSNIELVLAKTEIIALKNKLKFIEKYAKTYWISKRMWAALEEACKEKK